MNYSAEDRSRIQDFLIENARSDPRITDAALVGSESVGENDRWSDIDLTFGVGENVDLESLMADWSELLEKTFQTLQLFDLVYDRSTYRVFLTPDCLQIDLSFTPTSHFGAITENFKLLFGKENERPKKTAPDPRTVYGYFVLYALKTRTSIERGRLWQAIGFLEAAREQLMILACLKYGLNPFDGRGYDELPVDLKDELEKSLVAVMEASVIKNALSILVHSQLQFTAHFPDLEPTLSTRLLAIVDFKEH